MPPDELIGVVVHQGVLLARGDSIAVGLRCVTAFPTGLALAVAVRGRERAAQLAHARQHAELERLQRAEQASMRHHPDPFDADDLTGLQLAALDQDEQPQRLLMAGGETSIGDDYSGDVTYFISPLPRDGTLTLVCSCPELGLAETRTQLELPDLAARAAGAFSLWDSASGDLPSPD
jgi:hypothetical protein